VQPDGRVVIGGDFGDVNGFTRRSLARLNSDGNLDGSFAPGLAFMPVTVYAIAALADGKVLL